jgi:hypothetical protein
MPKPKQIFPETDNRFLDEHIVIWRYVPLRTLFFYLNGLIFIPSVTKLSTGDPFEGNFYEDIAWFNEAFSKHYENQAQMIEDWIFKKFCSEQVQKTIEINRRSPNGSNFASQTLRMHYFDFIRQTRFAWCWFSSNHESAAMWSVYGNQGVAVKTTVGKLNALFEKTGLDFIYGQMTYVDYQSGVSTEFDPLRDTDYHLLLRPFFLKRKEYESEHEVRYVTAGNYDERGGILLKDITPQDWISAIRLWPRLTSDEEHSLRKAIEQFMPNADCHKSDLLSSQVNLSDMLRIDSAADSNWTQSQDGVPVSLKTL